MEGLKFHVDKLEGANNWTDWKFQVRIVIQSAGCMSAIQGNIKYPEAPATTASEKELADCNKALNAAQKVEYDAQAIIVGSLSSQVRQLINMCKEAKEIWGTLHSIFEQRTEQRQDRLFNDFFGVKAMNEAEGVAKHIARLEQIWLELQDETWKEDQH
ncbi:hypothetical protein QE152_g19139 [Popillia japonica]|uniref:Uncharacterized protein n=1 Tax=Popillia japonica TaxID=7064 RepID=A0AAW1L4E2_POPJA